MAESASEKMNDSQDFASFLSGLPVNLSAEQQKAVQAVEGPVLLLAVPGSGKTTVLVARLGYMVLCRNIDPSGILTLTYTVSATQDMRKRFSAFFGEELGNRMEFRTINGLSQRIIFEYGRRLGRSPFELLSDDRELNGIISRSYVKNEEEYPTEAELKGIRQLITYIKNMMLTEDEIQILSEEMKFHLSEIYAEYTAELKARRCIDYDDQMVYAYQILRKDSAFLSRIQEKYQYILVDEAQDTSKIQHEIIALLSGKRDHLFMVGDEDQSIYGFRAAYPEALLNFQKNHPGGQVLLMEENFRSDGNIVRAADLFIRRNELRYQKAMKATRKAISDIRIIPAESRSRQYAYLLAVAKECKRQTAVLYRDNESAIPLVDLLERNQVPYRIRNAEISFFSLRVVNDILNFLRMSLDLESADVFRQIYYKTDMHLKKADMETACDLAAKNQLTLFDALLYGLQFPRQKRDRIREVYVTIQKLKAMKPGEAISLIIRDTGYGEYMNQKGISFLKLQTMWILAAREETVESFLSRMDYLKDVFQNKQFHADAQFILSTIHGSKGLEYDSVYLIDICDGRFPSEVPKNLSKMDPDEQKAFEEERRLFYVGITRAKRQLSMFMLTKEDSIFLSELAASGVIELPEKQESYLRPREKEPVAVPKESYPEFLDRLIIGGEVIHRKLGKGIISDITDDRLVIDVDGTSRSFNKRHLWQKQLLIFEK